jgi:hypothetical protein
MIYVTTRIENQQKVNEIIDLYKFQSSSSWLNLKQENLPDNIWGSFREDMKNSNVLLALIYKKDKKMSGGLIELGMAYAEGIPIVVFAEDINGYNGLTTFKDADNVFIYSVLDEAIHKAKQLDVVDPTRFVFKQINEELKYQESRWGGIERDKKHSNRDWLFFCDRYLDQSKKNERERTYNRDDVIFTPQLKLATVLVSSLRSQYCPTVYTYKAENGKVVRLFDYSQNYMV